MSYSPDARRLAVNAYKNSSWSLDTAAAHLGIARSALQLWVKRDQDGLSLEDRPRSGRPRKLTPQQLDRLRELTDLHPDWTQQRFADELNQEFEGLGLSQVVVCLSLGRLGITLKKNTSKPRNVTSRASSA